MTKEKSPFPLTFGCRHRKQSVFTMPYSALRAGNKGNTRWFCGYSGLNCTFRSRHRGKNRGAYHTLATDGSLATCGGPNLALKICLWAGDEVGCLFRLGGGLVLPPDHRTFGDLVRWRLVQRVPSSALFSRLALGKYTEGASRNLSLFEQTLYINPL